MAKKRGLLSSIFGMKCPKCRQGNLYKGSIFEGIYNMHKKCPNCEQHYEIEPGFFWGAMYIGYGLSSAYMLVGTILSIFVFGISPMQSVFLVAVLGIIIFPLTARLARSIWVHIYIHYDKNKDIKQTS